jgi:amidase
MDRDRVVETPHDWLEDATIRDLQARMSDKSLSSRGLVQMYLERIAALNEKGPSLRAVIEVNPTRSRSPWG